jgi:hypothetical protein
MRAVSKRNFNSGKYGTSSREGLALSLFFGFLWGCVSFGLSLAFPFCLLCDGSSHRYFIEFLSPLKNIYIWKIHMASREKELIFHKGH